MVPEATSVEAWMVGTGWLSFYDLCMGLGFRVGTIVVYWGYIGIMEKKMEATIVFWGYGLYKIPQSIHFELLRPQRESVALSGSQ